MLSVTLKGKPEEMGICYGQILKSAQVMLPSMPTHHHAFVQACEAVTQEHAPELMSELRAMLDAADLEYWNAATLLFTAPALQMLPSCSAVAVMPEKTPDGLLIVGRNYDFVYDISRPYATTYLTYPQQGYASVSNADMFVGRNDGLNEHGLFVGMSATFLPGIQPGLVFWVVVRMVLDRCKTVAEAVQLLQSIPHLQSRNYLLADKAGHAAVVEASINGVQVRDPENGVLAMTNHTTCKAFAGQELFRPDDSQQRFSALESLQRMDSVQVSDVESVLNDRESRLCAHGAIGDQPYGTIWSVAGHIDERALCIADGVETGTMIYQRIAF